MTYDAPPNDVRDALLAGGAAGVEVRPRQTPAPDVLLVDFGGSAITYRVRFWIDDFEHGREAPGRRADGASTTSSAAAASRSRIRFRSSTRAKTRRLDLPERRERFRRRSRPCRCLAALPRGRAPRAGGRRRANGCSATAKSIVREGDAGGSMFIVCRGRSPSRSGRPTRKSRSPRPAATSARCRCSPDPPHGHGHRARRLHRPRNSRRRVRRLRPQQPAGHRRARHRRRRASSASSIRAAAAFPRNSGRRRSALASRMRSFFGLT